MTSTAKNLFRVPSLQKLVGGAVTTALSTALDNINVPDSGDLQLVELAQPLLPFQVEAAKEILAAGKRLLGDEMGLGKTPTGIAVIASVIARYPKHIGIVVVPPSLRLNWKREFAKFAPWLSVAVLSGTKAEEMPPAQVYIVGDSTIHVWGKVLPSLEGNGVEIGAVVIDEAHRFKNYKARRTEALKSLLRNLYASALVVPMSGTFAENRPQELTEVIDMVYGFKAFGFTSKFQWLNYYAPEIDRFHQRGAAHLGELHTNLRKIMTRRLRADVIELPNKGRQHVAIEMSAQGAKAYKKAVENLVAFLREEREDPTVRVNKNAEALVLLGTLRRLAGASKVDGIIDYVRDLVEEGEQVFIATTHRDVADAYAKAFAKYGAVQIVGGMNDKAKDQSVQDFQSGKARVLVGNIAAAGVGFTLTAARHIVVAELPWTPGALKQVEDRLHRIGQTREVISHITIAANGEPTVDERVWSIIDQKARVIGQVLDGEAEELLDEQSTMSALLDAYR